MKYIYLIFAVLTSTNLVLGQNCANPVRRQEIRQLLPAQRTRFFNAIKNLRTFGGVDAFSQSCSTHLTYQSSAHGVPAFLPWHREYLKRYENALKKVDSTIVLPYWDWSKDSQDPETSPILSISYFGGNGRSIDNCVTTGQFANWQMTVPNRHCLKRDYDSGNQISSFYSPESLELILQNSKDYDTFRKRLEGVPHGSVHVNIGGDEGDFSTMYSPNDPIFYLHHAFIDMLWAEWQARYTSAANTYTGRVGSRTVSSSDNLAPFNVRVSTTFNTRSTNYCYFYDRFSVKIPKTVAPTLTRRADTTVYMGNDKSLQKIINNSTANLITPEIKNNLVRGRGYRRVRISPIDRSRKRTIRTPKPLPDSYLRRNNIDVDMVRQIEAELNLMTEIYNADTSYTPVADIKS